MRGIAGGRLIMGVRSSLATSALGMARGLGNALGCEMRVELSDHSIETAMVHPSKDGEYAWDTDLYVRGNVFRAGYANPIKPTINHNPALEEPDTVDVEAAEDGEGVEDDPHVSMISSPRYRLYMVQDLVSQLLNPQERLTIIMYILLGIAGVVVLMFLMVLVIASAVGVF